MGREIWYLNVYTPEVLLVQQKAGWDAYDKRCGCQQQLQHAAQLSVYIHKHTFLLKSLSLCAPFFTHCSTQDAHHETDLFLLPAQYLHILLSSYH
jgi:hypothetical protein